MNLREALRALWDSAPTEIRGLVLMKIGDKIVGDLDHISTCNSPLCHLMPKLMLVIVGKEETRKLYAVPPFGEGPGGEDGFLHCAIVFSELGPLVEAAENVLRHFDYDPEKIVVPTSEEQERFLATVH